jgi:MFS family permease
MHPAIPRHDPYASLRIPNFLWFIAGLLTMNLATQLQAVVVAWQIYALTHDPLSLGLIGLAEALPFIGFALPAGHLADRVHRLRTTRLALVALLGCSIALLGVTLSPGVVHGGRVWPIYLVIVLSGIARSFLQPARTALSAEVVPRELYPNAVTWRSSTWQLAAVLGPALGGLIYGFGSATAAYAVDVTLMSLALLAIARIRHGPESPRLSDGSIWKSLATGIRFVWNQSVILGALTLDLFSVLLGGATALLPIFAAEILHVGPQGLGLLRAAPAAGAVGMSLVLAHRPPLRACRAHPDDQRGAVRPCNDRIRSIARFSPLAGPAGRQRHGGHGERGGSVYPAAGVNARSPAGTSLGGQRHFHRQLERDRGLRIRRGRKAARHSSIGDAGRNGHLGRGWDYCVAGA